MWLRGVAGKGAEGRIAVNKSLGKAFSKGYLANTSQQAVDSRLRQHVDAVLASSLPEVEPYRKQLQTLLISNKLSELGSLPLWVAHYDINEVNVLIDDNCEVTGLIDWELSAPLPFGAGFGRIHTIAGEYTNGEFWVPDEFEAAERGFWAELWAGMPKSHQSMLANKMELVQEAVLLATILACFFYENGEVGVSKITLKALPKMMTYRIPWIRGEEPPYTI